MTTAERGAERAPQGEQPEARCRIEFVYDDDGAQRRWTDCSLPPGHTGRHMNDDSLRAPLPAPAPQERERHGWPLHRGVTCVECPSCAFVFAADHEDERREAYSCPNCGLNDGDKVGWRAPTESGEPSLHNRAITSSEPRGQEAGERAEVERLREALAYIANGHLEYIRTELDQLLALPWCEEQGRECTASCEMECFLQDVELGSCKPGEDDG